MTQVLDEDVEGPVSGPFAMLQNRIYVVMSVLQLNAVKLGIKRASLYLITGDAKAPESSNSVPVSPMEWQHQGAVPGTQPRCWEALPNVSSN